MLTNRWFWVGVFFVGGIVLSCYVAAVEDDAAVGRTTPYGRFRSRVRGALARATARRSDEATYVIVKDEDVPELAEVVSAEPYQAAS